VTHSAIDFGPRLIGTPTGTIRSAVTVRPSPRIELATPLNGEPGTVFARAAEQHDVLVRTLRYFGVTVYADESFGDDPYACAAAEGAVVFENGAMLMRPTSMSRRAEVDRLAAEFAKIDVPLAGRVTAPGLLDGTDVLLMGSTAFLGVGRRGNDVGRTGFAEVARAHGYEVKEVTLSLAARSLRSVASAVSSQMVVLACDAVDPAPFAPFRTIVLERGEEPAAGVLCIGESHVIASVRYRTALMQMRRAGITVEGIDLYDFEKIGLTPSELVLPIQRE
jgi:dimethylargininase